MFVPSVHSLGADEAESTSGSGGQKSGGVQLSEQDARDLLSLASSGTAALFASGTGKIAERQAAYQQGIAAQQASVQAAKDAKNAAKTQKIILYTAITGFVAIGGLGFMYILSKRNQ